jgi:hypothetical protein
VTPDRNAGGCSVTLRVVAPEPGVHVSLAAWPVIVGVPAGWLHVPQTRFPVTTISQDATPGRCTTRRVCG